MPRLSTSTIALAFVLVLATDARAQGRGARGAAASARADAPIDLTGQWVAIISEDWRWRMLTPPKGDIVSIPLTLKGQQAAEAWDPARDEAAGEQCKAYGAPGLMRGPIRMRVSWQDDNTLKLETDYGIQTRIFQFGTRDSGSGTRNTSETKGAAGPRSGQGQTSAQWIVRGGGRGSTRFGSLKTVTMNLRPGYLRKNGVPYGERAVFTEHWDVHTLPNGDKYLVNTNVVEDPVYLQAPFQTAIHYKLERNTSKWDPTPCDARF
ncbi:MAG TPA: hypothetical protein VI485_28015 [Vicinamibacterales bacterium]|nr:hypothetical protein [Vicinamibacterales bacterium]